MEPDLILINLRSRIDNIWKTYCTIPVDSENFGPPASLEEIVAAEHAFGTSFPLELVAQYQIYGYVYSLFDEFNLLSLIQVQEEIIDIREIEAHEYLSVFPGVVLSKFNFRIPFLYKERSYYLVNCVDRLDYTKNQIYELDALDCTYKLVAENFIVFLEALLREKDAGHSISAKI